MITLFIVGAGASCEFNLPIGSQLAKRISELASGSDIADQGINVPNLIRHRYSGQKDQLKPRLHALEKISQRLRTASSIDRFIDRERRDTYIAEIGKLLIVIALAEAERASPLASESTLDSWTSIASWCRTFCQLLLEKSYADATDGIGGNISIICFNYDRCIEYYLARELALSFGLSIADAAKIVMQIEIVHPYGTLGELPEYEPQGIGVPFGGQAATQAWDHIDSIKTFTEAVDNGTRDKIQKLVTSANRLVFLGFGYHAQNMELMTLQSKTASKEVFLSLFHFPVSSFDDVRGRINKMLGVPGAGTHLLHVDQLATNCDDTLLQFYYPLSTGL